MRLRERFPQVQFVGVEPGIKPAAARSLSRRIGVMATPATLASERFRRLVAQHAADCHVECVPCPGLAAAIEQGACARAELDVLLDRFCEPLVRTELDSVVLGCTHYPFVAEQIARRLPAAVRLVDTADAVARQAMRVHGSAADATGNGSTPRVRLQSTGDVAVLERLARDGLGLRHKADVVRL